MPNANPAGQNQPLNQHPMPEQQGPFYSLASDSVILKDVIADVPVLLVPPPPEGAVRILGEGGAGANVAVTVAGATDADVTVILLYIDSQGRQVLVAGPVVIGIGGGISTPLLTAGGILKPGDQGFFLQYDYAGGTIPPELSAIASFRDVRGLDRVDTVMTTGAKVALLPATPAGEDQRVYAVVTGGAVAPLIIAYNNDSAPHDLSLTLSNGVDEVPVLLPVPTLPAAAGGFAGTAPALVALGSLDVPPGWTLFGALEGAVTDEPVVVQVPVFRTNQGPARQDQGGAY